MDLGINGMELVAVEAAGEPYPPPPPPPPAAANPAGMQLAIYAAIPNLEMKDLPPKKRILVVLREEEREAEEREAEERVAEERMEEERVEEERVEEEERVAEEGFACNICGRIFQSKFALGGHRAHHDVGPTKKRKRAAAGCRVVFLVHGVSSRQCRGCGRVFRTARGVSNHIGFCKGVDLNGPPPVELVEEVLALPWR
ncbi:hypothetical protein ABFX02_04G068100 [Erythranthe guttata]